MSDIVGKALQAKCLPLKTTCPITVTEVSVAETRKQNVCDGSRQGVEAYEWMLQFYGRAKLL